MSIRNIIEGVNKVLEKQVDSQADVRGAITAGDALGLYYAIKKGRIKETPEILKVHNRNNSDNDTVAHMLAADWELNWTTTDPEILKLSKKPSSWEGITTVADYLEMSQNQRFIQKKGEKGRSKRSFGATFEKFREALAKDHSFDIAEIKGLNLYDIIATIGPSEGITAADVFEEAEMFLPNINLEDLYGSEEDYTDEDIISIMEDEFEKEG